MLPEHDTTDLLFKEGVAIRVAATETYRMDIDNDRIEGYLDDVEALKQAVYKEINTERDIYPIYNSYGVKKRDLFGKPKPYAFMMLTMRIKDALTDDDRIKDVHSFYYHEELSFKDNLVMSFVVDSIYGNFKIEEVNAYGGI